MGRRNSGVSVSLALATATACLLGVVSGCAAPQGRASARVLTVSSPDIIIATATGRLALTVPVYELTYDRSRDALWFATFEGPGKLVGYSIKTGTISTFELPVYTGNGYTSHVRVAPDGAVWVSTAYDIYRVDPATGQTRTLHFALSVTGALPRALDPSTWLPGTWVSALAFDAAGHALVARNNVPFLQVVDSEMKLVGQIDMPSGLAGVVDMTVEPDGLHALPTHARQTEAGVRTEAIDGLKAPTEVSPLRDVVGGNMFILQPDGSTITYNISGAGQLEWARPQAATEIVKFAGRTAARNAPNGTLQNVIVYDEVTAAAVDGTGELWFVVVGSRTVELSST